MKIICNSKTTISETAECETVKTPEPTDEAGRHFAGWWEESGRDRFPDVPRVRAFQIYIAGFGRGAEEVIRFQQAESASAVPQ